MTIWPVSEHGLSLAAPNLSRIDRQSGGIPVARPKGRAARNLAASIPAKGERIITLVFGIRPTSLRMQKRVRTLNMSCSIRPDSR
jgi:DNA mismatch repair protein MutH